MNEAFDPGEREFAQNLREALRSGERVAAASARLRAARARAVEAAARPARAPWVWGLTASACAAALALWARMPQRWLAPMPMETAQMEMLEMLGSDEAPVLYQDLDVLQSLDESKDPV